MAKEQTRRGGAKGTVNNKEGLRTKKNHANDIDKATP